MVASRFDALHAKTTGSTAFRGTAGDQASPFPLHTFASLSASSVEREQRVRGLSPLRERVSSGRMKHLTTTQQGRTGTCPAVLKVLYALLE